MLRLRVTQLRLYCIIFHSFENILYIPVTGRCDLMDRLYFFHRIIVARMAHIILNDRIGHSLDSVPGFGRYGSDQRGRRDEPVRRVPQFQSVAVDDAQSAIHIILSRSWREVYVNDQELRVGHIFKANKVTHTKNFGAWTERIISAVRCFNGRCTRRHDSFLKKRLQLWGL